MGRQPIFDRAMNETERSIRKRALMRERVAGMKEVLLENARTLLALGADARKAGRLEAARRYERQAERSINAANDEPNAPLIVTIDDPTALKAKQRMERQRIEDYIAGLERAKG